MLDNGNISVKEIEKNPCSQGADILVRTDKPKKKKISKDMVRFHVIPSVLS